VNQPNDRIVQTFETVVNQSSSSSSSSSVGVILTTVTSNKKLSTTAKATSPSLSLHSGEILQFTPKTPPKGIISYSARHAELSVSPGLAPSLSLNDLDLSYVETKEDITKKEKDEKKKVLQSSADDASIQKKGGRKRAVKKTENSSSSNSANVSIKTEVKTNKRTRLSK